MIIFIRICIVWTAFQVRPAVLQCDESKNVEVKEGNIGDVQIFPWVGVLRAKVFTIAETKVALTGIVLVRDKYCIGYADDVVKIRKSTMEITTRAMFIPQNQIPWYSKVKDYMLHPEYDFSTINTIALIELEVEYGQHVPVTPICWPPKKFNTTDLYVIGYTDEKKYLEKMVYKVDYVNDETCKEFYDRSQIEEKVNLAYPICVFAKNNRKNCVWDTGMVLASNATGIWTVIGLSFHGPGCSAPVRFIDLTKYMSWIETSSTLEYEENTFRKSAGDTEFHEEYSSEGDSDENGDNNFRVQQIADNSICIEFNTTTDSGDCTKSKSIVYSESMSLKSKTSHFSTVLLQIPIVDLIYKNYTCVSLEVKPITDTAYLWYNITSKISKKPAKTISKISASKGGHNTKIRRSIAILYLKIKYDFAAELKYLVHGKGNEAETEKDNIRKKLIQLKSNEIDLFKDNAFESNKKLNRKMKNDENIPSHEFSRKNLKINDKTNVRPKLELSRNIEVDNSNTKKVSNEILRMINLKCNKTIIPVPWINKTNTANKINTTVNNKTNDDAEYNNIDHCNNYTTLNMSISFIFIFATFYVLLSIFIKKGYVRLSYL